MLLSLSSPTRISKFLTTSPYFAVRTTFTRVSGIVTTPVFTSMISGWSVVHAMAFPCIETPGSSRVVFVVITVGNTISNAGTVTLKLLFAVCPPLFITADKVTVRSLSNRFTFAIPPAASITSVWSDFQLISEPPSPKSGSAKSSFAFDGMLSLALSAFTASLSVQVTFVPVMLTRLLPSAVNTNVLS